MMCLATVYVEADGRRDKVMQEVAWVRTADGELELINLMGESKLFQARIESIDLMNSLIVLKEAPTDSPEPVADDQKDD